jgi:hypothetical protein
MSDYQQDGCHAAVKYINVCLCIFVNYASHTDTFEINLTELDGLLYCQCCWCDKLPWEHSTTSVQFRQK